MEEMGQLGGLEGVGKADGTVEVRGPFDGGATGASLDVDAAVDDDASEPGGEGCIGWIGMGGTPKTEEDILNGILCKVGTAEDTSGEE